MSVESMIYDTDEIAPCPACGYLVWFRPVEVIAPPAQSGRRMTDAEAI